MASYESVAISVGGKSVTGWTSVGIRAGVESCPRSFSLGLTDALPASPFEVPLQPGDPCVVTANGNPLVTGYVDIFESSYDAREHQVRVEGRGKCEDLVDCSAEWPGGQILGQSALEVATKLAEPYGILVYAAPDPGKIIPLFPLMLGETAFEIIERIARYSALLVYEQADGSLLLARSGDRQTASGFVEGENVQRARVSYSMAERYSEILSVRQNVDIFKDLSEQGNLIAVANDEAVLRHRRLVVIVESTAQGMGDDVAQQRGLWEVARRAGRGNVVDLECDSWRDSAGQLWEPNTLALVSLPRLKLARRIWLIGEVEFSISEHRGTTARLTLMPPGAFLPEPLPALLPGLTDVTQGAQQ